MAQSHGGWLSSLEGAQRRGKGCPPPPVRTVEGEQRVVQAALHLPGALRGAAHPQPFVQPHRRDDGVSGVRALSPLGQSRGSQSRHPPAQRGQVPRQLPCSAAHRRRAAPGPARLCPGVCPPRPAPSSISPSSGLEGQWGGGGWLGVRERSGVVGVHREKKDSDGHLGRWGIWGPPGRSKCSGEGFGVGEVNPRGVIGAGTPGAAAGVVAGVSHCAVLHGGGHAGQWAFGRAKRNLELSVVRSSW